MRCVLWNLKLRSVLRNIDIYVSGDNIEYGMIDRTNWTASIAPNGEVSNRQTEEISHAYIESRTYQYYANSDRLKTDGRFAYVYDNNGNLVQKGNKFTITGDVVSFSATFGDGVEYWEYDYDSRNRLVAVRKSCLAESDLI